MQVRCRPYIQVKSDCGMLHTLKDMQDKQLKKQEIGK